MAKYSDLLKNPLWQRKRLEILQRDNFTCQHCKDTETELHVHHEEYHGKPWEIESDKLVTLCKHCHFIEESFDPTFIGCAKIKSAHRIAIVHNTVIGYMVYTFNNAGTYQECRGLSREFVNGLIEFHHNQLTHG